MRCPHVLQRDRPRIVRRAVDVAISAAKHRMVLLLSHPSDEERGREPVARRRELADYPLRHPTLFLCYQQPLVQRLRKLSERVVQTEEKVITP